MKNSAVLVWLYEAYGTKMLSIINTLQYILLGQVGIEDLGSKFFYDPTWDP